MIESSCINLERQKIIRAHRKDHYKHDFLCYYEKEINWFAFVFILTFVNVLLILMDEFLVFANVERSKNIQFPLRNIVYLLLANHVL